MTKRPMAVSIIAWLYIATGVISFASQIMALFDWHTLKSDTVLAEAVRLIAVVAGIWLLKGQNWARWLALGWMVFHVVLSAFHSLPELAIHTAFCAVIAYFLWRPESSRHFGFGG